MNPFPRNLGHRGFTIVEILVALMLVALVFALIPTNSSDQDRSKLEEVLSDFGRATRFAANEAILRNAMTRLTIDLSATPQEYYVEYSTEGGLALPAPVNPDDLSLSEREELAQIVSDLDAQFQRVAEFSKENKSLPEEVMAVGMANVNIEGIVQEGKAHVYFYPTGEKDGAILFFSTLSELATLEIPPFENTVFSDYATYSDQELNNIESAQESKMREFVDQWLRN